MQCQSKTTQSLFIFSLLQHSYTTLTLPAQSTIAFTMAKRCISVQEITKNLKLYTEESRKVDINIETLR